MKTLFIGDSHIPSMREANETHAVVEDAEFTVWKSLYATNGKLASDLIAEAQNVVFLSWFSRPIVMLRLLFWGQPLQTYVPSRLANGVKRHVPISEAHYRSFLRQGAYHDRRQFEEMRAQVRGRAFVLPRPLPATSAPYVSTGYAKSLSGDLRRRVYIDTVQALADDAKACGATFIPQPAATLDPEQALTLPEYLASAAVPPTRPRTDFVHMNTEFSRLTLLDVQGHIGA